MPSPDVVQANPLPETLSESINLLTCHGIVGVYHQRAVRASCLRRERCCKRPDGDSRKKITTGLCSSSSPIDVSETPHSTASDVANSEHKEPSNHEIRLAAKDPVNQILRKIDSWRPFGVEVRRVDPTIDAPWSQMTPPPCPLGLSRKHWSRASITANR